MAKNKKFLFLTTAISAPIVGCSLLGSTTYLYPDLLKNPNQFLLALSRVFRVVQSGIRMAYIYQMKPNLSLEEKHYLAASILKQAFLRNAGLYAKFGQIIASLDVIVPDPYRITFEPMCQHCPQTSYEDIQKQIETSTGKKMESIFRKFNKTPISSASIAQVHFGILHDGSQVAVKVQHPWLRSQCEGDIRLIEILVSVGERLFPNFKYKWFAEELRANIPKELDFLQEVQNSKISQQYLRNLKSIKIPGVYDELCNRSIITMEFIEGISLIDKDLLLTKGYNLKDISKTISLAFTQQLFRHGFVHSDPHQGNIMIRGTPKNPEVILLDHGLYTRIDDLTRISYSRLWKALIEQDEVTLQKCAHDLGAGRDYQLFSAMITSKPFDQIMSNSQTSMKARLGRPVSQMELDHIKLEAAQRHQQITILLNDINRTLLMLFKINDFLRTIDTKLGSPINTFQITYDEVSSVLYQEQIRRFSLIQSIVYRAKIMMIKLKLMFASLILVF